ncbi:MAG: hypothetical protein VKJ64_00335 [Leptolyngbyaceae bacterium]|nr:hypothetical protein [Leptolyngbyaceae bacterium]
MVAAEFVKASDRLKGASDRLKYDHPPSCSPNHGKSLDFNIMSKLTFASLSFKSLRQFVRLEEQDGTTHPWTQVDDMALTEMEQHRVQAIQNSIVNEPVHLMNEATIWARAIYPLLMLAERGSIRAWGEVSLNAVYPRFELDGIADGVLGKSVGGRVRSPYLVVLETKRGIEGQNPTVQLYGQLLAAAWLNWQQNQRDPQEIFGCYTIADS